MCVLTCVQSPMWGVFPSVLHFFCFSLRLELAGSASSPASASPALGLQICAAVPGFYMGAGALNSDPCDCTASALPTERCPQCPCKAVCPVAAGGSSYPQMRLVCHFLDSACLGDVRQTKSITERFPNPTLQPLPTHSGCPGLTCERPFVRRPCPASLPQNQVKLLS